MLYVGGQAHRRRELYPLHGCEAYLNRSIVRTAAGHWIFLGLIFLAGGIENGKGGALTLYEGAVARGRQWDEACLVRSMFTGS